MANAMYLFLQKLYDCLESNGCASFLIGDSHGFKMVHVETAKILGMMSKEIGFKSYDIELWWNKRSIAHKFLLPEYILEINK